MVRDGSVEDASGPEDGSNPHCSSIEDPPTYEESLADDCYTNLTWPHSLPNRDELAQILHVNNFDYSTRGRAFTVSGPTESQVSRPRYRNIINYFENSLDDMSSVDWSRQSLQRSYAQVPRISSSSDVSLTRDVHITRAKSVPGPRPHNIGTRSGSRDVIHWDYINEINPSTRTRFTVRVVPNTDEPPNYSAIGQDLVVATPLLGTEERPVTTAGTCSISSAVGSRQPAAPRDTPRDVSRDTIAHVTKTPAPPARQPSAPSLEQIQQPDTQPLPSGMFNRTVTAPGRLEKDGALREEEKEEVKERAHVSFYMGGSDENSNPNIAAEKAEEFRHGAKEARTSETGDSGYGDEGCIITDVTPLKAIDSFTTIRRINDNEDHVLQMDQDDSRSKLMQESPNWENHRLFRYEEPKEKALSWKFWLGVGFFLCDVILVLVGALLLILNYHDNLITGFALLGVGIGMCIPALNYIGGFPTVCAGVGT